MSDDVSRLFPYAAALLMDLKAEAVVVLAYGSATGMNGCAPALMLDKTNTPAAVTRNTRIVRAVADHLRMVADRLEADTIANGIQLEPRS